MFYSFPSEIESRWNHKSLLERAKSEEHVHSFCRCVHEHTMLLLQAIQSTTVIELRIYQL